jgi:hypothetical protein
MLLYVTRDIAQLGRAPALGAGGRRFESYYPEPHIYITKRRIRLKRIALKYELQYFY